MRIASFKIENYKSFLSTPEIPLTQGFNVIVGQNNVGKTALVEALSLKFLARPHRTPQTVPRRDATTPADSTVTVSLEVSRDEIFAYLPRLGGVYVPVQSGTSADGAAQALQAIPETNILNAVFLNGGAARAHIVGLNPEASPGNSILLHAGAGGEITVASNNVQNANEGNRFETQVANLVAKDRVYAFAAERLHIGKYRSGPSTDLQPTASNLPEVLMNLRLRQRHRFDRFVENVRTILPGVRDVALRQVENDQVEILIWTIDPMTERDDLAVTLAESGTGIGQVLAILYVVVSAESPQMIIIDEPQSFLHPGAVRKLIEILKQHPTHQYIITTHSPAVVTAAQPNVLLLLRLDGAETIIDRLDPSQAEDLRVFLAEIGARLSDVFGMDNIVWVEGRTEEECFQRILRHRRRPLRGTAIVGVVDTGAFEGRRSEMTIQVYDRLSGGSGLVPRAIAYIFDREGRTAAQQDDLRRRGKVHFTPRRMYENYLLNPAAIAAVASSIDGFRKAPVTEGEVSEWLERSRWDTRHFETLPAEAERTPDIWSREVRGAKILVDLFTQLSETRVAYDKVRHGVALTEWLLEHSPEDLDEVGRLIEGALSSHV